MEYLELRIFNLYLVTVIIVKKKCYWGKLSVIQGTIDESL